MLEHSKAAAAFAVALSVQVPPLAAAILTWLRSTQAVLVIVGFLWGVGAWVFLLWYRDQRNKEKAEAAKELAEKDRERRAEDDARQARFMAALQEVKDEQRALRTEHQELREVFQKVLNRGEFLLEQVKEAAAEVKRAHARLDTGREKFAELEVRVASIGARQGRRFGRDDSDG